jgi:hypothetical protein
VVTHSKAALRSVRRYMAAGNILLQRTKLGRGLKQRRLRRKLYEDKSLPAYHSHFFHPLVSQLCSNLCSEKRRTADSRPRARIIMSSSGDSDRALCSACANPSAVVAWKPNRGADKRPYSMRAAQSLPVGFPSSGITMSSRGPADA